MFSYTGLSEKACEALTNDHHIYLLKSGRISLAGLNKGNVSGNPVQTQGGMARPGKTQQMLSADVCRGGLAALRIFASFHSYVHS